MHVTLLAGRATWPKSFGPTTALRRCGLVRPPPARSPPWWGPSGSGKSTLLHCLADVVTPDSGSITYDGREIAVIEWRRPSAVVPRRSAFGFVCEFGRLVTRMWGVGENVALPLRLNGHGPPGRPSAPRCPAGAGAGGWRTTWGKQPGRGLRRPGTSGWPSHRSLVHPAYGCCSPTSRPARWTSLNGERVMELLARGRPALRTNAAVVLVTHEGAAAGPRTRTARSSYVTAARRDARRRAA